MKKPQCSDILLTYPDLDLTVKDMRGNTPFATALAAKDHQAGKAILKREPKAAEQVGKSLAGNWLVIGYRNIKID